MAAKIAWQLEIQGIDITLKKLRELNVLLDNITRKGGNASSFNNSNTPSNNPVSSPSNITNASRSGNLSVGEAVALGAIAGGKAAETVGNKIANIIELKSDGIFQYTKQKSPFVQQLEKNKGLLQPFNNPSNVQVIKGTGGSILYANMKTPNPTGFSIAPGSPPIIPPPNIKSLLGSNQLLRNFPNLNNPTVDLKGNQTGIGGLLNKGANSFGQKFSGFIPILAAVYGAFKLLKTEIDILANAIKNGAEAFTRAAKFGRAINQQFALDSAFKTIGLDSPDLALLQGQFNKKAGKFELPDSDAVLGAARASGYGDIQQLQNLLKEFTAVLKDSKQNSQQMAESARANFIMTVNFGRAGREFTTLLAQTATLLFPVLNNFLKELVVVIHKLNNLVEHIKYIYNIEAESLKTLFPKLSKFFPPIPAGGDEDFKKILASKGAPTPTTSLEKIGFVFSTSSPTNAYIKATATYTKDTVKGINEMIKIMRGLGIHINNPVLPLPNLP